MNIGKVLCELNKENIFKYISPEDIYRHYMKKFQYNKSFSSPFRVDKNPSFTISKKTQMWIDFTTGDRGDCFEFVKKLYNLDYNHAMIQIVNDLSIQNKFSISGKSKTPRTVKVEGISNRSSLEGNFRLRVKIRDFQDHDLDYWNCHGISLKYLKIGGIHAVSHYFMNNKVYVAEKYAYVYVENKDSIQTYKIYQPYSKYKKWINGNNYSVWELWNLLPETHDKLIITSSRKDALSIIENVKIPATSFQAESVNPKKQVVQAILKRFKTVYLLYDNDYSSSINWGQKQAQMRLEEYDFTNIVIPDQHKSKDFSDLVCNTDRITAINILKQLL